MDNFVYVSGATLSLFMVFFGLFMLNFFIITIGLLLLFGISNKTYYAYKKYLKILKRYEEIHNK